MSKIIKVVNPTTGAEAFVSCPGVDVDRMLTSAKDTFRNTSFDNFGADMLLSQVSK